MPLESVLECAFHDQIGVTALARKFGIHRRTAVRAMSSGCMAYMHTQELMLSTMVEAFEHAPPDYFIKHLSWDETGEKLTVKESGASSRVSTHEVMVARMRVGWGWAGCRPMQLELVIPPTSVRTPAANSLYYALMNAPYMARIRELLGKMMCMATKYRAAINEIDGASGNDKLCAHLLSLDEDSGTPVLHCSKLCHLHQNHLITTAVVLSLSANLIARLYSMALLLRSGGYFRRLHLHCSGVISSELRCGMPRPADHDPGMRRHTLEVMQLVLRHAVVPENTEGPHLIHGMRHNFDQEEF